MYHIKQDKRAITSAQLIVKGLESCLKEKEFNQITITDIQKASTISRATFYRLFDSLTDVLAYQCDLIFEQLSDSAFLYEDMGKDSPFYYLVQFWLEQEKLMEMIVKSNHMEILYATHQKYADQIGRYLLNLKPDEEKQKEYLIGILTAVLIGVFTVWVNKGKQESARELSELAMGALAACQHLF